MTDYEEQWEVYPSLIDDEFAMFAVNLGPQPDAPYDNLRWLSIVRMRFHALPSGMPDSETNQTLYAIEDLVAKKVAGRGGIQVGRLTVAGLRELFFYGATDETDLILRDLAEEFGENEVDVVVKLDAEWKVYLEFLYPQPIDFQRIRNQRVVRVLTEHGDNNALPRKIDHFAYFPDEATRREFAREVGEGGYDVTFGPESDDADQLFALTFSHVAPVELAAIDRVTVGHFRRITELGGDYDGWGCEIASGDDD